MGFDIEGSTNTKLCYCPCGKDLEPWRKENSDMDMLIDDRNIKKNCRNFIPQGIMQHLKTEGKLCILHYGTMKYLEKLYGN